MSKTTDVGARVYTTVAASPLGLLISQLQTNLSVLNANLVAEQASSDEDMDFCSQLQMLLTDLSKNILSYFESGNGPNRLTALLFKNKVVAMQERFAQVASKLVIRDKTSYQMGLLLYSALLALEELTPQVLSFLNPQQIPFLTHQTSSSHSSDPFVFNLPMGGGTFNLNAEFRQFRVSYLEQIQEKLSAFFTETPDGDAQQKQRALHQWVQKKVTDELLQQEQLKKSFEQGFLGEDRDSGLPTPYDGEQSQQALLTKKLAQQEQFLAVLGQQIQRLQEQLMRYQRSLITHLWPEIENSLDIPVTANAFVMMVERREQDVYSEPLGFRQACNAAENSTAQSIVRYDMIQPVRQLEINAQDLIEFLQELERGTVAKLQYYADEVAQLNKQQNQPARPAADVIQQLQVINGCLEANREDRLQLLKRQTEVGDSAGVLDEDDLCAKRALNTNIQCSLKLAHEQSCQDFLLAIEPEVTAWMKHFIAVYDQELRSLEAQINKGVKARVNESQRAQLERVTASIADQLLPYMQEIRRFKSVLQSDDRVDQTYLSWLEPLETEFSQLESLCFKMKRMEVVPQIADSLTNYFEARDKRFRWKDWFSEQDKRFRKQFLDDLINELKTDYLECGESETFLKLIYQHYRALPGNQLQKMLFDVVKTLNPWEEQEIAGEQSCRELFARLKKTSFASVLKELEQHLAQMESYAAKISTGKPDQAIIIKKLAKNLKFCLRDFVEHKITDQTAVSKQEVLTFQIKFFRILHSKDEAFVNPSLSWKAITANVILGLLTAGIVLVARLAYTKLGSTRRAQFFYSKTAVQEQIENCDRRLATLDKERDAIPKASEINLS